MKRRRLLILVLCAIVLLGVLVYFIPDKVVPLRAADCAPNRERDAYVYSPERFLTLSSCMRVTGIVRSMTLGAEDGDAFFDLQVDAPFENLLNMMNDRNTRGFLHIESNCYRLPEDFNDPPFLTCINDPNPFRGPFPAIGQHIWVEGRWVWDLNHGGHAELHPLYRWGDSE